MMTKSPRTTTPALTRRLAIGATAAVLAAGATAWVTGALPVGAARPSVLTSDSSTDSTTTQPTIDDRGTTTSATMATTATTSATVTTDSGGVVGDGVDGVDGISTHQVADAGTVTIEVDSALVTVVSAVSATGWSAEIEADEPGEAEVNFRRSTDRVDFRAEINDGQLRVRIRDRRTGTETESVNGADGSHVSTDDDRSGPGDGSGDDRGGGENSGPGSGGDDNGGDRSGRDHPEDD